MDRHELSALAHAEHPVAAPISDVHVRKLVQRARNESAVLDLGCGAGEWVLRAAEEQPAARAVGVDLSDGPLRRAEDEARRRGIADRVSFVRGDVREYRSDGGFGLVMCVGAVHAFGGLTETLRAASEHLAPGGSLLIGDGYWERPPDERALRALGADPADLLSLADLVDVVEDAGWTPVHGHVSEPGEWDDYEWSWSGSLTEWALDHRGEPDAAEVVEAARCHRDGWLRGYRGVLGFVTLLLRRSGERRWDVGVLAP
jgi:SAM-dependent methyltransferase